MDILATGIRRSHSVASPSRQSPPFERQHKPGPIRCLHNLPHTMPQPYRPQRLKDILIRQADVPTLHKTTALRSEMDSFLLRFPHTTSMDDDNHHRQNPTFKGRGCIPVLASVQAGFTPTDLWVRAGNKSHQKQLCKVCNYRQTTMVSHHEEVYSST